MLKKLKYLLVLTVCTVVLAACGKDEDSDGENETTKGSDSSSASNFDVEDVYADYAKDGNKITTVYGTVEYEDWNDVLTALKSETVVLTSSVESSISGMKSNAGVSEINDEFISKYCSNVNLKNEEEIREYVRKLVYKINVYEAVWDNVCGKFKLTDYNQEAYDALVAESDAYYTQLVKTYYQLDSIEAFCESNGISLEEFRKQYYMTEDTLLNKIVNLVIAKELGLDVTEEKETEIIYGVGFQYGYGDKSLEDIEKAVFTTDEEKQMTCINYMVLDYFAENVKIVDDIEKEGVEIDQTAAPQAGDTIATFTIKDYGTVKIRLFPELAPKAVENFVTHAKDGYYNGLTFHRVIEDFMIQGGDPKGDGTGGESIWKDPFEDEFSIQLAPVRGALCMANSGENTNGSQFFIVQSSDSNNTAVQNWTEMGMPANLINYYKEKGGYYSLFQVHTVFGQVFEGMDVIDKIAGTETDEDDKPKTDVIIEKIDITTY